MGEYSFCINQYPMNQHFAYSISSSFSFFADIHTFSAKEKDTETGLSYFGARYYSSDLSIWLSVDPMSDKYPSLSPYTYCANNPIKLVDPNGEEVVNVHEKPMKAAQNQVNYWTNELTKHDKGSSEYSYAESKLEKAQHDLKRETENYNAVKQAINDFKSKMPEEFTQMDNLTKNGETIDVYVSIKNFEGAKQMGQCVIDHNGFTVHNSRYGLSGKGVEVKLNSGYPNLGKILAHEFGHVSYEVANSVSYDNWLNVNGHYNEKEYDGHGKGDPSGARAYEWERRYDSK